MKTAVIYARVSSQEQADEGFSIPAQLKLLREYAAREHFEIVREFVDVETAKTSGRQNFTEMVTYLADAEEPPAILVEKVDRLHRNFQDYVTLDELDPEIHFVRGNSVISGTSPPSDKFMYSIMTAMAKHYSDNLSHEVKKGMRQKASQGTWPSAAPIGYRNVRVGNERAIAPHPINGPIVRRLFEAYATRNHSLSELREMAADEGLRSSHDTTPSISTLHRMLRSAFYLGRFVWDDREYEGDHPPLISEDLFQRVQDALDVGHHTVGRSKRTFAYAGLLTCEHCGCAITAGLHKGKYIYYRCTQARGKCPTKYIREEKLEELLGELVKAVQIDEETVEWVVAALKESHADERAYHDQQIETLMAEVKRLRKRLDQAYQDHLDNVILKDQWQRVAEKWRMEKARLLRTIEQHENANEAYFDAGVRLLNFARRAYELWLKQPQAERRELLDLLLLNCTFDGERLRATYAKPFCWLAEGRVHSEWRG